MRRMGAALLATMLMTIGLGNAALADHVKAICEVQAAASAKLEQGYVLVVRLHTLDGKPVNETTVSFYEVVEFFGQREVYLGSALTDGQGLTSFAYLPARLGPHAIIARSKSRDHFTSAEGRTTFDATVAAPPYRAEPVPLAAFTAVLPYGVGVIVLSVWALLAFALFGTVRGVVSGGRDQAHKKGDTA